MKKITSPTKVHYKSKNTVVLRGDTRDAIKFIPDNSVDLVFTSPPYNTGTNLYDIWGDDLPYVTYISFLTQVIQECERTLKIGGHLIINMPFGVGRVPFDPYVFTIVENFRQRFIQGYTELNLRGFKIWLKPHTSGKGMAIGSIANKPSVNDDSELLVIYRKTMEDRNGFKGKTPTPEFKKAMNSTWLINPATSQLERFGHNAVMPIALADKVIQWFTRPAEIVFDPFAGVGTTLVAARRLNRLAWGIELSSDYCDIIKKRLRSRVGDLNDYLKKEIINDKQE